MSKAYVNGVPCTVYNYGADGWADVLFNCFDVLFKVRNELIEVCHED